MFVAWNSTNSPLSGNVAVTNSSGFVSGTATAVEVSKEVRARSSNVAVVWAGNASFALADWWASLNRSNGGNEESNNEGSEAGHFDYLVGLVVTRKSSECFGF